MSFQLEVEEATEMHEINMTPLVDVMLVLLVVFMITLPVMKHATTINLPQASTSVPLVSKEAVRLTVDAGGVFFWNAQRVSEQELEGLIRHHALASPSSSIELHGDKAVRYESVAQVFAMAKRVGLQKLVVATQQGKS
jgi:biopolymer transport protein ExbD